MDVICVIIGSFFLIAVLAYILGHVDGGNEAYEAREREVEAYKRIAKNWESTARLLADMNEDERND